MKLTIKQEDLIKGLDTVARIIPSAAPAITDTAKMVKITAEKDKLVLYSNNKIMAIITKIPSETEETGAVTVNALMLFNTVKKLMSETIHMETKGNLLHVKAGKTDLKLPAGNPDDYFPMPSYSKDKKLTVPAADLKSALSDTAFVIDPDNANFVFTGTCMKAANGQIIFTALDGISRVVKRMVKANTGEAEKEIIIPFKTSAEMARILPDDEDGTADIYLDDSRTAFLFGDTILVSGIINGKFPNLEKVFVAELSKKVPVNTAELIGCIDRAVLFEQGMKIAPTEFHLAGSRLGINIESELGDIKDSVDTDYKGDELLIKFHGTKLFSILKHVQEDTVEMELESPKEPCRIKTDNGKLQFVIMPLSDGAQENGGDE